MNLPGATAAFFLLAMGGSMNRVWAAEPPTADAAMAARVQALIPDLQAYATRGMKAFDDPGLVIGIVDGDKLAYVQGFGVRGKSDSRRVGPLTIFQIGSTTKAFLATTEAIMVDRGRLKWDDRVVDLYPAFKMMDPQVGRDFRVYDLLAQRSSLPPLVNDVLVMTNFDEPSLIASLGNVEPVSVFRTTFSYTNITHLLASRIVAKAAGAADWNDVLQSELLDPLGMKDTTYTVQGIQGAADHANGHRWTPTGVVETRFTPIFPYHVAGAGDINSNVVDMAKWVRLQLGDGVFEGRRIVSSGNLDVTRRPMVKLTDNLSYAMGWYVYQTPNGPFLWHDGDALSFGSFVALSPDRHVGVIILTNESHVGLPNVLGAWVMNRLLGNPDVDNLDAKVAEEKARFEATEARFAKPANPRPPPPPTSLAGTFHNPSFGEVEVFVDGDALNMDIRKTKARFKLTPLDGATFVAELTPWTPFGPIVDLHYMTRGFAEFQPTNGGKPSRMRLTLEDGQRYDFTRE
jgi:CubicO group peptidase (beta-lactamase class C family)